MLDDIEITRKKIMSSCTDSEGKVYFDEINKPGISNLISILAVIKNQSIEDVEEIYKEFTYKDFKTEVANNVCDFISNIQIRFNHYRNDEKYLKEVLINGADKARKIANNKIELVKEKVGLKI